MVFQCRYRLYIKEILYILGGQGDYFDAPIRDLLLVNHSKYRKNKCIFNNYDKDSFINNRPYAYGLLMNPFKTNILGLDFDNTTEEILDDVIQIIQKDPMVIDIDKVETGINSYHLWLGLDEPRNVLPIFDSLLKFIIPCEGFIKAINLRNEITMRVSQKIGLGKFHSRPLIYKNLYRRQSDTIWYKYTENQIVFPLYCNSKEDEIVKNTSINFRRTSGINRSITKSESPPLTTERGREITEYFLRFN